MHHHILCSVFSGESDRISNPYLLPLGIVYCASALKQNPDYQVSSYLLDTKDYYEDHSLFLEQLIDRLIQKKIDIFCISGLSVDYVRIKQIVTCVKNRCPQICVIIGGGLVAADPDYVLEHIPADFGLTGEGEQSLTELVSCIGEECEYTGIRGLVYRTADGSIRKNAPADITDLDKLPFPDFTIFPEYAETIRRSGVYPILLSRSCPFQCSFCFHTSGERYRTRSVESVLEEIIHAKELYGIRHLFFLDELFGVRLQDLQQLLPRIQRMGISFNAQTRADVLTEENIKLFKENGCTNLSVGIESASDTVLESMGKRVAFEQIEKALTLITEHGIATSGNIIIGDIAETSETAQKSMDWYKENREKYHLTIGMVQCYPGTKIFEYAIKNGLIEKECFLEQAQLPKDFVVNLTHMPDNVFHDIKKQVNILSFMYETSKDYLVKL